MTTSSPLPPANASSPASTSASKPHLSSLSVGPTPRPPPSLASTTSPAPAGNPRRITSWGSINSEGGLSVFGERGMTPLPSPMDSNHREWGYLPQSGTTTTQTTDRSWQNGGGNTSWGRRSHGRRWDGGDFATTLTGGTPARADSPLTASVGKSWMSNFQHQLSPSTSSGSSSPIHPSSTTTDHHHEQSTRSIDEKKQDGGRSEPVRSKTLSFFDSSSPVIAPSSSCSSLFDPSVMLLSPPPNPPPPPSSSVSRNNSLNSKPPPYQPNRPRSSSRLSISSDFPVRDDSSTTTNSGTAAIDPLRSSTGASNWLADFSPAASSAGAGGLSWSRRSRVPSIGSWSSEVNKAAIDYRDEGLSQSQSAGGARRMRTETTLTNASSSNSEVSFPPSLPVERRLFMNLDDDEPSATSISARGARATETDASSSQQQEEEDGLFETVKGAAGGGDRPRLAQLDTSFLDTTTTTENGTRRVRERSISNTSTGSATGLAYKPLSALPTAVEAPFRTTRPLSGSGSRSARYLYQEPSTTTTTTTTHARSSYRDSPPPPIDLSQVSNPTRGGFLAAPPPNSAGRQGGQATPRTPPSMEELQKIIGGTTISCEPESEPDAIMIDEPATTATTTATRSDRVGKYRVVKWLGKGAFSRVALGKPIVSADGDDEGQEFALKLIERKSCETNERMRISVLREVQVLKNISHPSLVALSSSFLTRTYTVLVLDYCPGGELFDFLANHHAEVTEALARRMFSELSDAVGWMHRVGLVHRDIKLENILLTFHLDERNIGDVLTTTTRLIKLTDFGLSRFVNPEQPLLRTRCGSEAYAAPELLMGKPYDGRLTDSWAVGVVLFAIATGGLPFVEEMEEVVVSSKREPDEGEGGGLERRVSTRGGRKGYLLKIAKAEYSWPSRQSSPTWIDDGLKEVVARLLVRDPTKRWSIDGDELWSSAWMSRSPGHVDRVAGSVRSRPTSDDQVDFNDAIS
ncbi:hypothetical protein JCM3766R1_005909 [Sporobolomyces carnicolor]